MRSSVLFLTCLTACLFSVDTTNGPSIHILTSSLLTSFLLSWMTFALPNLLRPIIQLLLGECVIAICIVDCYCQVFFGAPITPQLLSNVQLSDTREAHEFLSIFVGINAILHWRIASLLLLAILFPISFLLRLQRPTTVYHNKKLHYAWMTILSFCVICEMPALYKYSQLFIQKHNMENMEGLIFRHYHEQTPTPVHRIIFAYFASTQSGQVLDQIKRSTFEAEIDGCEYISPHIVLIIGESYNKHHSSLYGYRLPTAPLQQKRLQQGKLFLFSDIVAPWNITSNVFIEMFSLWEHGCRRSISQYPLFPILFQRAGYKVTFFSNQYCLTGFRKGATNQAGHFFLAAKELSNRLFSYRNRKSSKYDLGLFTQIKNYMKDVVRPSYTLDIVHLKGQHFEYSVRYPQSQSTFSIGDYEERTLPKEAKQVIMHYDNATKYNDMVLDSLLSLYEKEEAVVLFVADHGEEVYDELAVHGRLFQEPTATQARYEYEVPMWIWCSESYRQNHPDVIHRIKQAQNKPFMTDGLPQILLSLAGLSCRWRSEAHNLLSPTYRSKHRIIGGNVNYDHFNRAQ